MIHRMVNCGRRTTRCSHCQRVIHHHLSVGLSSAIYRLLNPPLGEGTDTDIQPLRMKNVMDEGIDWICRFLITQNQMPVGERNVQRMGYVNPSINTLDQMINRIASIEWTAISYEWAGTNKFNPVHFCSCRSNNAVWKVTCVLWKSTTWSERRCFWCEVLCLYYEWNLESYDLNCLFWSEIWLFERMEKLELRGQRVARMRIFSNDINRNVINLAFNYMSIARAVCIRGRVLNVVCFVCSIWWFYEAWSEEEKRGLLFTILSFFGGTKCTLFSFSSV